MGYELDVTEITQGSNEEMEGGIDEDPGDPRNVAKMAMSPLPGMITDDIDEEGVYEDEVEEDTILDVQDDETNTAQQSGSGCGSGMEMSSIAGQRQVRGDWGPGM